MNHFRKSVIIMLLVILSLAIAGLISIWIHVWGTHNQSHTHPSIRSPSIVKSTKITIPVKHKVLINKPIIINNIGFKFNEYKLLHSDKVALNKSLEFAKKNPNAILVINGYCSKMGTYSYNYKLSLRRALSVKKYLEKNGIDHSRIKVIGHSYNDPIDTNATPHGRFKNQRVSITSSIEIEK